MATSMVGSGDLKALRLSRERPAATQNGFVMLLVWLAAAVAIGIGFWLATRGIVSAGLSLVVPGLKGKWYVRGYFWECISDFPFGPESRPRLKKARSESLSR